MTCNPVVDLRDVGLHAELDRIDNELYAHMNLLDTLVDRLGQLAAQRDSRQLTYAAFVVNAAVLRLNAARIRLDREVAS